MALSLGSTREDYLRLRIWLLQAKMGERNAADQELSELLKSRNALYAGVWEHQIAEYLACTRPENDLLLKAGNRIQECQVFFYIGSRRLVDGDADGAREFFGRCVDTRQDNFREYRSAVAELERMK
jgi:lipoprotein NlpI